MNPTERFAQEIRIATCDMLLHRGFGHLGAALSMVEALAVLYHDVMKYDPKEPKSMDRDWFVLSKGHGGPSYYATLALSGFFDPAVLRTLNQPNTILPSHPDRSKTPGVDATTGSLGQGVSQAVGIAKGLKIQRINRHVYSIVGDGEMNEGQVYEALIYASKENLDNFTVLIDYNKKQLDGRIDAISMKIDYMQFFEVLRYDVTWVDGKNTDAIQKALAKSSDRPKAIILDTIKAQGIPYFEALEDNHHLRFNDEQKQILETEIKRMRGELNA